MKRAKKDLNVKAIKTGMKSGWEWCHPGDLPAEHEEDHEGVEDAQSQSVAPFGGSWSPSGDASESNQNAEGAHEDAEDAQSPGVSAFDPFGTLSGNGATEKNDDEAHI